MHRAWRGEREHLVDDMGSAALAEIKTIARVDAMRCGAKAGG